MNRVQLIFSPTGGTMRAAKAITDPWGPGVETIDLTDPALADRAFQKEDLVLIAVPSYGGRGRFGSQGWKRMYPVRSVRRPMSGPGDQPGCPAKNGRKEMCFLYALCCAMSPWSAESQRRHGFGSSGSNQKSVFRQKRMRIVHLIF